MKNIEGEEFRKYHLKFVKIPLKFNLSWTTWLCKNMSTKLCEQLPHRVFPHKKLFMKLDQISRCLWLTANVVFIDNVNISCLEIVYGYNTFQFQFQRQVQVCKNEFCQDRQLFMWTFEVEEETAGCLRRYLLPPPTSTHVYMQMQIYFLSNTVSYKKGMNIKGKYSF